MNRTVRVILWIVVVIALVAICWYFASLISYILISIILSLLGAPVVRFFKKLHIRKRYIPSWLAAVLTLVLFIKVIVLFFALLGPLLAEQARSIAQIDVQETAHNLEGQLAETEEWLEQFNLSGDERSNREYLISKFQQLIDFSYMSKVFNNFFSVVGQAFIAVFSILFITFFLLKDGMLLQRVIFTLTPDKHLEHIKNIESNTKRILSKYFVGVLTQITIITILISTALWIIGIENAVIIGFLAGIANLIPYVGPIIGACLGIFIAITTHLDVDIQQNLLPLIGKVAVVFLLVQLIDNFLLQPFIIGSSVNAHPLEIFLVISAAATLGGVVGMIVAIPCYTMIRIVAKEFLSTYKIVQNLTRKME